MRAHFYKLKKPCPQCFNAEVELTDEIKEHILKNRVYIPPKKEERPVPIINNNYQQINNYVNTMDIVDKMNTYKGHAKLELIDFSEKVEDVYASATKKLVSDANKYGYKYGFKLKSADFLEIIDEVSKIIREDFEDFNLIYDEKLNKIKMYDCGDWETNLIDKGLARLIQIVQDAYLDAYEYYLLKKIRSSTVCPRDRQELKEHLHMYYKFIQVFDVNPLVKDKSDIEVLSYPEIVEKSGPHDIEDEYIKIYDEIKDKCTRGELSKIKKEVLDIIKRNSKNNIQEFNKKIMGLVKMDTAFKNQIVGQLVVC
jgi:hypothetical protein